MMGKGNKSACALMMISMTVMTGVRRIAPALVTVRGSGSRAPALVTVRGSGSRAPALVTVRGSGLRAPALSIFICSTVRPIPPRSTDSCLK
jgi:hypothetical protein